MSTHLEAMVPGEQLGVEPATLSLTEKETCVVGLKLVKLIKNYV